MDIFIIQRQSLTLAGHNFNQYKTTQQRPKGKHYLFAFLTAFLNVNMIWFTVSSLNNINLVTASLSIILANSLTVAKMVTFTIKLEAFLAQMQQFEDMFKGIRNPVNKALLTATNNSTIRIGRWYSYLAATTGFYFMMAPIMKIIWSFCRGQDIVAELPYPMKYPFEIYSWRYILIHLYSGLATWFVVFYVIALDGIFIVFIVNLRDHFRILQSKILNNDFCKTDDELVSDMTKYAKYHNFLLELSNRVRDLYKPIILSQFLVSSLQFCVIILQIVNNIKNFTILVPNLTFLGTIFVQLLIYCYGGEMVMQESLQVNSAIQATNWYILPPKHRRMLCFIMQRSQKPAIIKAGFYRATLESFMMIVQAAMSYITLMQSLD